jgi:hypothetical protein
MPDRRPPPTEAERRGVRQAEALRANLLRRKAQLRARSTTAPVAPAPDDLPEAPSEH